MTRVERAVARLSAMRVQKVYKYRYEVLPDSVDQSDKVNWIYSRHCLRAGHHYEVRVNEDPNNPQIVAVVREIDRA